MLLAADLNVFPLSEISLRGKPRLAVNRLKLLMKASVVISGTSSKCTALITQHVYKQIHTLFPFVNLSLVYSGPAKSTPVYVKAGCSFTLKSGRGGGGGELYG